MKAAVKNDICKISLLNLNTGIRICIGLFMLCFGGVLSFILLRSPIPVAGYVVAGIFIIIAIRIMGRFHYLIADPARGTLIWNKGIIFSTSTEGIDVEDITGVLQIREVHSHKNGSVTYYIAKVQFKDERQGGQNFMIGTSIDPAKGEFFKSRNQFKTRKAAEKLATFLKLPLIDKTRGKSVVRSWDELDMSVAEKWARESEKPQRPSTPDFMFSRVSEMTIGGINFISIRIPSLCERYPKTLLFFLPLIISLATFILYQLWGTKDLVSRLLSGWVGLPAFILIVTIVLFAMALTSKKVRVNENQIHILYKYAGFFPWTLKLNSSEIEEIDSSYDSLALVTDKRIVPLINGGEKGEAQFCLDIIKYTFKTDF